MSKSKYMPSYMPDFPFLEESKYMYAEDDGVLFKYIEEYDYNDKTEKWIFDLVEKGYSLFDAECDILHSQGYTLTDDCEWVKKLWEV